MLMHLLLMNIQVILMIYTIIINMYHLSMIKVDLYMFSLRVKGLKVFPLVALMYVYFSKFTIYSVHDRIIGEPHTLGFFAIYYDRFVYRNYIEMSFCNTLRQTNVLLTFSKHVSQSVV